VFDEVLQEALSSAGCIVVLWSRTSVTSNWVKTEAAEAATRHVLVPAIIEDVAIPIEFRRIQAANLQSWTGNPDDPAFESLVQSIEQLSRGAGQASSAQLKAHAPGSVLGWTRRRLAVRTIAKSALILAAVAASFLMGWVLSRPGAGPASATVPQGTPGEPGVVPTISFENSIAKPAQPIGSITSAGPDRKVNLLAAENGGHLVAASSADWQHTIDGNEGAAQISYGTGKEAVYAFKSDGLAAFDTFAMLIGGTESYNINEFELLVSREASGPFHSIGKFHTQNLRIFAAPYQTFRFPLVEANYLKFRLISTHGGAHPAVYEFQLLGILVVGKP